MAMVALDAPRTKVVPTGSLEARWLVNEGDVSEVLKHAKKHPKMQALMKAEAEQRLEAEKVAAEQAALEKAARLSRLKAVGLA
jgi:hypothetical protein